MGAAARRPYEEMPVATVGGGNCGAKATAAPSRPKVKMDDETIAHRVFGMRA